MPLSGCGGEYYPQNFLGFVQLLPQPKGDNRRNYPVPPEHVNDTFWNVMRKNGRSYSIQVCSS